jgi:hypothetical protein
VGRLSDRAFRLWIGMLTQADDEGRLVADLEQLRVLVFGYQPKVLTRHVAAARDELREVGLVRVYRVEGTEYAEFPSWQDHQSIDRPKRSKLPPYDASSIDRDESREVATDREGSRIKEGIKEGISIGPRPESPWPSPSALVELYNAKAPDECPAVTTLSPKRRTNARKLLATFPEQAWWEQVFTQMHASRFLRGLKNGAGHDKWVADFDWLLAGSKSGGTENCVLVHDGRYLDG